MLEYPAIRLAKSGGYPLPVASTMLAMSQLRIFQPARRPAPTTTFAAGTASLEVAANIAACEMPLPTAKYFA
jgi:hypothetical protein